MGASSYLFRSYRGKTGRGEGLFAHPPSRIGLIDFPANGHNRAWFKFKTNIAGRTGNYGTKDIKIIVPLKSPLENH